MAMKKIKNEIRLNIPLDIYSEEALTQTAAVWRKKADVYIEKKNKKQATLTLEFKTNAALNREVAAEEFLNEALNQEYRQIVGRFNQKLTQLIVVQALCSASQTPPKDAAEALEPMVAAERAKEVDELMRRIREESGESAPKTAALA